MERRTFLLSMLGLATVAAVPGLLGPQEAQAAMPRPGDGILDELDADAVEAPEAEPELVNHRPGHRRPRRRRVRRRQWRRFCNRVRSRGRWVRRCYRRRVWVTIWI